MSKNTPFADGGRSDIFINFVKCLQSEKTVKNISEECWNISVFHFRRETSAFFFKMVFYWSLEGGANDFLFP